MEVICADGNAMLAMKSLFFKRNVFSFRHRKQWRKNEMKEIIASLESKSLVFFA